MDVPDHFHFLFVRKGKPRSSFPSFLDSLLFSLQGTSFFLSAFPSFPWIFRGSAERKILAFLGAFSLLSLPPQKKIRKGRSGKKPKHKVLGGMSRRRQRGYPGGRPGKHFTASLGAQESNFFFARTSLTRRCGHPWPEGVSEKLYAGKLRADLSCSPVRGRGDPCTSARTLSLQAWRSLQACKVPGGLQM